MGYVERNLAPGEHIIYRTKQHPIIFVWAVLLAVSSLAGFLTGRENLGEISAGLATLVALYTILMRRLSDFAVTNRRVIGKFFVRHTNFAEVALVELRTIKFTPRGVLSALFDYGDVVITDAQGKQHRYPVVPGEFYRQIQMRLQRIGRILK